MRFAPSIFILLATLLLAPASHAQLAKDGPAKLRGLRTWTDKKGRQVVAALQRVDVDKVVLERRDGQQITIELDNLSKFDQIQIRNGFPTAAKASSGFPEGGGLMFGGGEAPPRELTRGEKLLKEAKEKAEAERNAPVPVEPYELNLKGTIVLYVPYMYEISGTIKNVHGGGAVTMELPDDKGELKLVTFPAGSVKWVHRMQESEPIRIVSYKQCPNLIDYTIHALVYRPEKQRFDGVAVMYRKPLAFDLTNSGGFAKTRDEVIAEWKTLGDKDILQVKSTWTEEWAKKLADERGKKKGIIDRAISTFERLTPEQKEQMLKVAKSGVRLAGELSELAERVERESGGAPAAGQQKGFLCGHVIRDGKPVKDAVVVIWFQGAGIVFDSYDHVKTDANGYFQSKTARYTTEVNVRRNALEEEKFKIKWYASQGPMRLVLK